MPPEAEDDDPIGIERLRLGKQSPEGDRRDGEPTQDEQAAPLDRTDRADGQRCVYCPGEGRGRTRRLVRNRSAGALASARLHRVPRSPGHVVPHTPATGRSSVPRQNRLRGRSGERRLARQHLVEHAAERVDVAPAVELALAAAPAPGSCTPACRARARSRSAAPSSAADDRPRDAEVRDHGVPACEQDVLGLDVAMHDAVRVRVVERVGDLAGDADAPRRRRAAPPARADRRSDSPSTNGMT